MPYKNADERRAAQARYREKHREAIRARRVGCAAVIAAGRRRYYAENKEKYRERSLVQRYGMTLADFDRILAAQGGLCAVCETNEYVGPGRKPHVDHDHATGKVRGLVCVRCNVLLGMAQDQPARFHAAIRYLKRHELTTDPMLE